MSTGMKVGIGIAIVAVILFMVYMSTRPAGASLLGGAERTGGPVARGIAGIGGALVEAGTAIAEAVEPEPAAPMLPEV